MSTAQQDRFFSLSGYVVNELRTRLDEDRAEKLCLMSPMSPNASSCCTNEVEWNTIANLHNM
ncbi:hypothetical protein PHMEG_00016561 [Phytophthora megakarya]|uniref:HAT C-terminal dimerisation domain-containing protein n=1 Tax=Phytophthora megakarya TaxID=4795 RepID=A0A225W067_9STRA|nr:hypothetical protein PHMEG_00016561 [Phytophthora megakarya]